MLENNSLYLLDKDFLIATIQQQQHDIYVRITSLDINDNPIEQIEGRATGGSINVDGSSSVRRTCNITMITENVNINDVYWGIKTKFILEIGLYNHLIGKYNFKTNTQYPEIVWFPQGQFLISSFNASLSLNSCSISLSGKDKMCLLNGDLGGQLYASIDFGTEEIEEVYMEEIVPPKLASSKEIVSTDYYIKIEHDENVQKDIYYDYNPYYIFVLNNNSGKYYKVENEHYYQYNGNTLDKTKQHFDIYAKNQDPSKYFKSVVEQNFEYQSNKYYYVNKSGLYILDTSENKVDDHAYYFLVPLYTNISNITKKKIPLEKIIREAVHTYAQEPYENIIINDLDQYGLEQLTYKGDKPLYGLVKGQQITDLFFNNEAITDIIGDNFIFYDLTSDTSDNGPSKLYYSSIKNKWNTEEDLSTNDWELYYLIKFDYGMDIGYHLTDLTYTGDLISGVGDTLTSILDKIKTMLSDFEYFYDINGRFVFQKKKTYVNSSWSQLTTTEDETYVNYLNASQKTIFNLNDNLLISTIQNSPVLNNIRNDFIVWGKRKSLGQELPIHTRFAIDKKPICYKTLSGKIYLNRDYLNNKIKNYSNNNISIYLGNNINWIHFKTLMKILQIEEENYNNFINVFISNVNGADISEIEQYFAESDIVDERSDQAAKVNFCEYYYNADSDSYQIYPYTYNSSWSIFNYLDPEGLSENDRSELYIYINTVDWREIIYQMALDYFKGQGCSEEKPIQVRDQQMTSPDDFLYYIGKQNSEYYPTGYTGYEQYYTDMQGFWRQLYNPEYFPEVEYTKGSLELNSDNNTEYEWQEPEIKEYNIEYYFNVSILNVLPSGEITTKLKAEPYALKPENDLSRLYWNRNVFEAPETLNFWIDFLDSDLELAQFSIPQIGDRTKVVNETSKATSIIYPEVPDILITYEKNDTSTQQQQDFLPGYTPIYVPKGYLQYFDISHRSKSLKDQVDELLQQYSYCIENITITSVPIYFLEPNSLIYVHDDETKIDGNYIVNRLSIPLTYNGMMSITATKVPERII